MALYQIINSCFSRTFVFVLLYVIFLSSCVKNQEWTYQDVKSSRPEFKSFHLDYSIASINGIGVELLRGDFGVIGYLSVNSNQIQSTPDDPSKAEVVFQVENDQLLYRATKMLGGQRVKLSQEAVDKLLTLLGEGKNVNIYLKGYSAKITPNKFSKQFKKFSRSA